MPGYSTQELQTLMDAAAYKSGVELNNHGFQKLSDDIIKESDPYGLKMTPRYLKEGVWQKLQSAQKNQLKEIGLHQERADTLAMYLGFPHYRAFRQQYQDWRGEVDLEVVSKRLDKPLDLCVLAHPKDEELIGKQFKQTLDYAGIRYSWLNPCHNKTIEELEESIYGIWLLSNTWKKEEIVDILSNNTLLPQKAKNILLFKLGELSTELEELIPVKQTKIKPTGNPQLGIIVSLLKSFILQNQEPFESINQKNELNNEVKKIKKFKGIILEGDARIKGKYVAGGNMYIRIKKNKD